MIEASSDDVHIVGDYSMRVFLGYGLTLDVHDQRVNWHSDIFKTDSEPETSFLDLCRQHRSMDVHFGPLFWHQFPKLYNWHWRDSCAAIKNEIFFIPPEVFNDWVRVNRTIDYYSVKAMFPDLGKEFFHVREINEPPSPYSSYEAITNSKPLFEHDFFVRAESYTQNPFVQKILDRSGLSSWSEYKKYVRPMIPQSVIALASWLEVFIDPKAMYELRPKFYIHAKKAHNMVDYSPEEEDV